MVAPVLGETKPVQGHTAYLAAKPGTESGQCVHTRCGLPSPRHRPGCGMHGPGPRAGGSGCRAGAGLRVLVRLEVECSSLNALPVGPSSASTKQNVGRRNPRKTYVAWVCSSSLDGGSNVLPAGWGPSCSTAPNGHVKPFQPFMPPCQLFKKYELGET